MTNVIAGYSCCSTSTTAAAISAQEMRSVLRIAALVFAQAALKGDFSKHVQPSGILRANIPKNIRKTLNASTDCNLPITTCQSSSGSLLNPKP